nr:poly [ADP-ribose] polymerase 14-like [Ciona intestinalis]|eukprot:XP_026696245.1 poly [ADP-ribose] polymerase 14-like [Ciona intestinalis]
MVQPLEKPNEKYMNDQAKFESECKRRYGTYLRKFATTITHIDSKILKGVRLSKGWNESEQVVAIDAEVDVFVRWNHKRQGNIEITCRQGDVKTAIEFFKSRSKCVKESVPLKEIHFRAFVDCCIIDDLRETYKQRVDFFVENNAIHLSGNQYDVAEAKNEVLTKRINLDSCKLPGFPSQLTMFMIQSLNAADANKLQPGSVNLRFIIQEEFRQRNVKVSVQVQDDNIQLIYLDTTHRDKATTELSNLLKQVSIPCNESMDAMLQQHEWKRLRQGLCSNKNLRIIQNSHQNEIILLGLAGPFKGAQKNIEGFIRQNISGTNLVRMEYISAKFVENYFKDSLEKSSKGVMACVRWGISDGGGIEVKGKDVDVKKAVSWLQGIVKSIKTTQHQFSIPGIPAFFRDKDKSKTFLSFTEKENKCIIMVDSCTLPSWGNPYANMGNKLKPKIALKTVHSMRLQGSNVEVKILRGDITEVNCDAIVNASNDKLELRDAGISGSIKKKCGPTVQAEMNQHIASVGGTMLPGSAVSTSAGRMNCRRIIHVVGPVWKGDISDEVCEAYLKSCVSETLKEAERYNLTSVAMPAISCGVFGGSVSVCPRLMVETLVDHFMKPSSCIKQIYFVENSNNEVIQSFSRSLQGYSNSPPQTAVTPQPIFTPAITPRNFARTTTGSALNVRLVQGDISTQNVDVIVTTGSPQNFAKGSGSAITQALIRIAGPQLQREMQKIAGNNQHSVDTTQTLRAPSILPHNQVQMEQSLARFRARRSTGIMKNAMIQAGQTQSYQVGDVVHTSGYRLQCTEVYHVIVANYQPNSHNNSKHNLVKAIKTCLQNADQAGYATIAFPTLATGGFGYPARSVARWMKRELDSFKPKHLKQVVIAMLPTDSGAVVFQNEFNSQTQRNQLSSSQSSKTIGSINVIVKQGDITIENSDAIICPTAQSYDLSGQVGQAILQRGGQSIQTELQQQLFTQKNYSVTGAGQLACKHVFHIVTGNDGTQMENVLMEVFEQADSLRIHSLSIPAIGTGNSSLTSSAAARHINRAIHIFEGNVRTSPTLHQINIVVFQHQMMADFQQEFGVSASQANVASKSNQLGLPKFSSAVQDTDNVTLYICSNQQNNVDKALKSINQHIQNITSVKYIDDEIIKQLTSIEVKEIGQLARKHQVKIETTDTA